MGCGGFAKEVLSIVYDLGYMDRVVAFVEADDKYVPGDLMGKPIIPQSQLDRDGPQVVVAIGNTQIRWRIVQNLPKDTDYATLIHPSANVSPWVTVEPGCVICAGAVLTTHIHVGAHTHINLNATIGHDCQLGKCVTLAPGVNVSGSCLIRDRVFLGSGACVRQNLSICEDTCIGMGTIVVKSIQETGTYVGNPARRLR